MSGSRRKTGWTLKGLAVAGILLAASLATTQAATKLSPAEGRAKLIKQLKAMQADPFEFKNSDQDMVKGFTTASQAVGDKHIAYVFVDWGDLNNLIKGGSKDKYSNWDGYVKVTGGTAEVVRKFAFDDGTSLRLNVPAAGKGAAGKKNAGPGEGSGRDELITSSDPSEVAWKSGVVGATDGLLVKLTLAGPQATGEVKAGKFTFPFTIKPGAQAPAATPAAKPAAAKHAPKATAK